MTNENEPTDASAWTNDDPTAGLQPLRFLEGAWHSRGQGPYGPYDLVARGEVRGRWLLLTYEISAPESDDIFYFSTQVYGYDDHGLTLELFDTAGSFSFRGDATDRGSMRFDWRDGDSWKRSEFRPVNDGWHFRYDSFEPALSEDVSTFEGPWTPDPNQ